MSRKGCRFYLPRNSPLLHFRLTVRSFSPQTPTREQVPDRFGACHCLEVPGEESAISKRPMLPCRPTVRCWHIAMEANSIWQVLTVRMTERSPRCQALISSRIPYGHLMDSICDLTLTTESDSLLQSGRFRRTAPVYIASSQAVITRQMSAVASGPTIGDTSFSSQGARSGPSLKTVVCFGPKQNQFS